MVAGAGLLATFFLARAWSANSSDAGIAAFEAVVAQRHAGWEAQQAFAGHEIPAPDFSLWSEQRIAEYRSSLAVSEDLPLALLSIGRLDLKVPVFNGANEFNLNRGVARIKGTARLDTDGNLGIAGHRDGFFRGLKDIAIGDRLHLETQSARTEYRITSIEIVAPSEVRVLAPTDQRTLTLVTCYPFYFVGHAPQRFIVKAEAQTVQVRS